MPNGGGWGEDQREDHRAAKAEVLLRLEAWERWWNTAATLELGRPLHPDLMPFIRTWLDRSPRWTDYNRGGSLTHRPFTGVPHMRAYHYDI